MIGRASRNGLRCALLRSAVAALAFSFIGESTTAEEKPSLKEILGRAQSDSERKAVEDLIGKLQGKAAAAKTAKPPPPSEDDQAAAAGASTEQGSVMPSPETAEQPSLAAKPSPASEGDPAATAVKAFSEPPAGSAERPPAEPPEVAARPMAEPAEAVVEKAERKELASVDLEVLFEFDSAKLTPAAVETLTTLGRALVDERLAGSEFLIGGHTDAKGPADYNQRLSQRRAEAVRQFLIATFAISPARLAAKGFGSRYLKNPRQRRAPENRRVQVVNVSRQEAR